MSQPRVYVTHDDGRFDFTDAERFGKIIPVVQSLADSQDFYPDNIDDKIPAARARATQCLAGFDTSRDFLCLVGNPVIQALCMQVLTRRNGSYRVNVLRFDRKLNAYYPVWL